MFLEAPYHWSAIPKMINANKTTEILKTQKFAHQVMVVTEKYLHHDILTV